MQKSIAYILLFIAFLPVLAKMLTIGDYALRKAYYAAVLCEKKDSPQASCCEGRCQLKKNLQAIEQAPASSEEAPQPLFVDVKFDVYDIPASSPMSVFTQNTSSGLLCMDYTSTSFDYAFALPKGIARSLFHPPAC